MRYHDPELVKATIDSQKLTRIIAFEPNERTNRIGHQSGTPKEVADYVDFLMGLVQGPFRIECGVDDDKVGKGGRLTVKRSPFEWLLWGNGQGVQVGPSGPAAAPAQPATPNAPAVHFEAPKGFISVTEHQQALQLELLKAELKQLTHCEHGVHLSRSCATCDADGSDDLGSGHTSGNREWYADPENVKELVAGIRDIVKELRVPVVPAAPTGAASRAITGASGSDEMSEADRVTWAAICNMRAHHPEEFETYRSTLVERFAIPPTQ